MILDHPCIIFMSKFLSQVMPRCKRIHHQWQGLQHSQSFYRELSQGLKLKWAQVKFYHGQMYRYIYIYISSILLESLQCSRVYGIQTKFVKSAGLMHLGMFGMSTSTSIQLRLQLPKLFVQCGSLDPNVLKRQLQCLLHGIFIP